MAEKVISYKYGEGRTLEGQVVQFSAPVDVFKLASDSLLHFNRLRLPVSSKVSVEHGGYGRYSRYNIEQLEYAGGQNEAGGGYYELLNIRDAPDGRHPIVTHGFMSSGEWMSQFFAEWESIEAAMAHWKSEGHRRILTYRDFEGTEEMPAGLLRTVETGYLSPWFYATGDAELIGDYVFPETLANDPTFTFGRQFLVPEKTKSGLSIQKVLKTCMGCAIEQFTVDERSNYYGFQSSSDKKTYRVVQWHDGTTTSLKPDMNTEMMPVPLADADTWVVDAQRQFNELLAGGRNNIEVNFADGGKFVGKYVPPDDEVKPNVEGDYYVKVTFADGEAAAGWVNGFVPTPKHPTVTSFIEDRYLSNGRTVLQIEVVNKKPKTGGKKWQGVFHSTTQPASEDTSNDGNI